MMKEGAPQFIGGRMSLNLRIVGRGGQDIRVYFEAYGCTLNKTEGRMLMDTALHNGCDIVDSPEHADLLVISTCVVIQSTEQRMMNRINALSGFGKHLVVSGCLASTMAGELPDLDGVIHLLPPGKLEEFGKLLKGDGRPRPVSRADISTGVAIADGCVGHCTYCITRLARGGLKSVKPSAIVSAVESELARGCREIRITAQDTGPYGMDLVPVVRLPELIKTITSIPGDFMVRLGMMNPDTVGDIVQDLVALFENHHVYKFLHIPLQSGSDRILKLMERGYSSTDLVGIVNTFKDAHPGICVATDVIAGFPTESHEDHLGTISVLESIRPDVVNIKGFSARPGTVAKKMKGRVRTEVVKQRTKELTDLHYMITRENYSRLVGRECKVLLTEKVKPGTTMGRNMEYRPIVIEGEFELGTYMNARITGVQGLHLKAEPI
jgi:MiaB-like tRNA modifying enzyme